MKDAYSFCEDEKGLDDIYKKMHTAYSRIIERMDLRFRAVDADTGLIGGKSSHEFLVLANEGEETLVYCPDCDYAANIEMAGFKIDEEPEEKDTAHDNSVIEEVSTPGATNIDSLVDYLNIPKKKILKTVLINDDKKNVYSFLIRADRQLNIVKAEKFLGKKLEFFKDSEDDPRFTIGYVGPVGLDGVSGIYGDNSIKNILDFITGANKMDTHLKNVNIYRDFEVNDFGDFSYPLKTDGCIKCGGDLQIEKGIEIGHIFRAW